ncbi:putative transmembrane protein [Toxoplasma gondii TgCatPRC2]|uniref:Transmembrane protein n=5 Tax=Toxoplasma gondii TaxID=5811 RepID=S8G5E3_TOXGM|nr:hypothetical protein TGME49_212300 [Toxoplasma gondii ME49]KFG45894.1 putative transmembrane protein [Toxoplasma gondii GAB2-2007-GAL-DOM2]KYF42291.1 hypothetical protein TGARI_212300 [Toxoplasma gondii ARI]KYK71633.1 putative transmembrane protein [Toxoplasma gondii TgCatPRC2]PIM03731.1 putative transmembrane protein [Toxoplasma gondii COUG]EPT26845.1 hypothetical protein TGME49_212300 [Toxoplasma gondii ME49]|eukprot:XP_002371831.1 hypothetical protein TGME49_212300 [Toxoplasma gondii ME49]
MSAQGQQGVRSTVAAGKNRFWQPAPITVLLVLSSSFLFAFAANTPQNSSTTGQSTPSDDHGVSTEHIHDAVTVDAAEHAGEDEMTACSPEAARVIEARVATLKAETEAAVAEVRRTEAMQRELFGRLNAKVRAMNDRLDELSDAQKSLAKRLETTGQLLIADREEQAKRFTTDVETYIIESGLKKAVFQQREIAAKLQTLAESNQKSKQALDALLQHVDDEKEQTKQWISTVVRDLEKYVEARTQTTLESLQRDAQEHANFMQQQLNDMKLDHLLLLQAVSSAETQLNERGIAGVDISQLDESASFERMMTTFEKVLKEQLKGKFVLPIFVVTQCPDSMERVAFMNTYLVPSKRNFRAVFQALGHTPQASAVVIRIESVMVEAWMEVNGKVTGMQYLTPPAHEALTVTTKDRFGFEFLRRVRELETGDFKADPHGRSVVIAFVGNRKGRIGGLPLTDVTEFNKFQALRTLATMHSSPIKETNNLWQIMKTEVDIVATFAAMPRVEVGGSSLRIYQGIAPEPRLPASPFCRNAFTLIRIEVAKSPRGKQEYVYPKASLLKKVFDILVSTNTSQDSGGDGSFAVIRANVSNAGWLQSKLYATADRMAVEIHRPVPGTAPPSFSSEDVAGEHRANSMAAVVDQIRKQMTDVVLPNIDPEDSTSRRQVLVHICEIGVTCNSDRHPEA